AKDMRRSAIWVQADIIGLAPAVGLARQLVGHGESCPDIDVEGGPVQPDGGLAWLVRVEIHDHDDGVCRGGAVCLGNGLGKAQNLRPVGKVESQVSKLRKRRMRSPDRI